MHAAQCLEGCVGLWHVVSHWQPLLEGKSRLDVNRWSTRRVSDLYSNVSGDREAAVS